ncbi:hypothetical protein PFICI_14537 [Pestalotiopsis fici W106-1]|uniref:Uncharacterized protein n=1 Tax=Pestalotiopsis fici (strain W106-1 / CGMCC3.15140) TaxID=1229662 RepID=W3WLA3_PESFW|nr:uncharacterized protein PFICI_14537 [Pestalotiopsis fici W106-1]ETS73591.1 hypothetical protein PFICI_14537 [Pestalotiopsis fici W106-1]
MNRSITTPGEAPLLRLSTELYQMIAEYLKDPEDLAALVNCCKTCMLVFGKDFVHIRSAKRWALEQAGIYYPAKSTLQMAAACCFDKDVFMWILDLYIKHYPQCIERDRLWYEHWSPEFVDGLLEIAIRYGNTVAVQAFLDRGMNIPRSADVNEILYEFRFPLSLALWRTENPSYMNIVRSLLDAGHYVTQDPLATANTQDRLADQTS